MKLPPAIAARMEEEIARLVPHGGGHVSDEGIRFRALPLMGTIGAVWLLRADGSLWAVDSDLGKPFEPLPERLHTMALAAGSERYPWLKDLLPSRPLAAIDCANCECRGQLGPGGAVFCPACDALGWRIPGQS